MINNKKTVCVVSPKLGVTSEVWMLRQLEFLTKLQPMLLTWELRKPKEYSFDGMVVEEYGGAGRLEESAGRWVRRLLNVSTGNFFALPPQMTRQLVGMLLERNVSALLCHFGHAALQMLPVAKSLGIPLIPHFHGLDISSGLNNRWYRWSLVNMARHFPAVVCVGSEQRNRLAGLGVPEDRIHLIPCGVPVETFPCYERLAREEIRFLCVSRLVPWKGVHHSIGAFARIADRLPGSRLVVVGEGSQLPDLKRLAEEKGISANIDFAGPLPESGVREMLRNTDIFLQHSLNHSSGWFEGFGVSIAEAASTGMPVVVSACGGILDQVVDGVTGLVVAQRDEIAMADAMFRLASDPALRRRMGLAGRDRVAKHFDTPGQVEKLENVILGALRTAEI